LAERFEAYISSFLSGDSAIADPELALIDRESEGYSDLEPSIGPVAGGLLALLVRLMNAKRVLEFGAALGYSTIWLASALKETGGTLVSVELRKDRCEATLRHVNNAGLGNRVQVICGDAEEVAQQLSGPFDLILQDSAKALYPKMLERCIQLARTGGLIVADDVLFKPMGMPEKYSTPIHEYNEAVFKDRRLRSVILPVGDGVLLSYKRSE